MKTPLCVRHPLLFSLVAGIFLLALASLFTSCDRKNDGTVQFDATDALAVAPNVQWAVVSVPYTACYADVGYGASVSTHYRRGAVLLVEGAQMEKDGERMVPWYYVADGWLPESSITLFTNKLRAERYSETILSK